MFVVSCLFAHRGLVEELLFPLENFISNPAEEILLKILPHTLVSDGRIEVASIGQPSDVSETVEGENQSQFFLRISVLVEGKSCPPECRKSTDSTDSLSSPYSWG